jgi:NhaA family Na+:H+ antiporter
MKTVEKFLRLEILASAALAIATIAALICANSSLADAYQHFLNLRLEISLGTASLAKPLILWINDGLMAVFFLLVSLELKREILEGELSSPSQVILPLVGAIGGIALPAVIFLLCVGGDTSLTPGWAIPIATDIAFALGVLALFGNSIPKSLKTFLLTLAIFDDLGAILVIAFVYTGNISWVIQGIAFTFFLLLVVMNKLNVTRLAPYCIIGGIMWLCVLKSGVHATLAGVLLGLTIPLRTKDSSGHSPLHNLEHGIHPWVAFLILPIFAFGNAGVSLTGISVSALGEPLTLGIILGLLIGKGLGVFGLCYLVIKSGKAKLPEGSNMTSFFGVAIISGIGFTMSLFIGSLAFESSWEQMGSQVRLGVLCASFVAAILGASVLKYGLSKQPLAEA